MAVAGKIKFQGALLRALDRGAIITVTNLGGEQARRIYTLSTTGQEIEPFVIKNLLDGELIKAASAGLFAGAEPQSYEIVRNL